MATLGGCVRSSESPPELLDLLLKRFNAALVDRRNRFVFGALDPPSMKPSQHPFTPPAKARRTSTLAGPGRIPKVCLFDAAARACCRTTATGSNGLRRAQGRDHFTFPPLARACNRIEPTSPPPQRWSWLPLKRRPYSRRLRKAERCLKQVEKLAAVFGDCNVVHCGLAERRYNRDLTDVDPLKIGCQWLNLRRRWADWNCAGIFPFRWTAPGV